MEKFFFTFGVNQLDNDGKSLGNYYYAIKAKNSREARQEMFFLRGDNWSFQYSEKDFEGQIEDFNLKEAKRNKIQIK